MDHPYRPRARDTKLLVQELPDEVLIYDIERNEVHCLNGTAAQVWALCNGERSVAEIARLIGPDLELETAETVVWCALDQFGERHLLEQPEGDADEVEDGLPWASIVDRPADMTRRQMVVRLGLIVGLALPAVESIVSPPAAMAQSGLAGCSGSTQTGGSTPCIDNGQ